jgi:putative PIN family toxin of toxin-antitoxin system
MVVVLDTNALLVSIPTKSIYRPIIDALIDGEFSLVISNDILSEYTEVIEQKANAVVSTNIAEMLLSLDKLKKVEVYFEWKLIEKDPDDNKYVDAAIVGAADFIVTNDRHFNILKSVDFPKVNVIGIDDFLNLILQK